MLSMSFHALWLYLNIYSGEDSDSIDPVIAAQAGNEQHPIMSFPRTGCVIMSSRGVADDVAISPSTRRLLR